MSQPTTHPNLSVTLTIGKASYPVLNYIVDCEHNWDDKTSTYIYGEPTLDVTVDRPTFLAIVHQSPLALDTLRTDNYQGERTGMHIITPLPGVVVRYTYPRKADIKCPKCEQMVYSDQLCNEWDSEKIVMGSGYGRLCEVCWQEYNAANAANSTMASAGPPVQSDASSLNLHFDTYTCVACGNDVDRVDMVLDASGTGYCPACANERGLVKPATNS